MKFLRSPLAMPIAICCGIIAFGIGLTSPIWLIVSGQEPLDAIHAGTPIVGATIIGLIITTILGVTVRRLQGPPPTAQAAPHLRQAPSRAKQIMVEATVILMFVVPFLTIIVGYLLHKFIDFDAG